MSEEREGHDPVGLVLEDLLRDLDSTRVPRERISVVSRALCAVLGLDPTDMSRPQRVYYPLMAVQALFSATLAFVGFATIAVLAGVSRLGVVLGSLAVVAIAGGVAVTVFAWDRNLMGKSDAGLNQLHADDLVAWTPTPFDESGQPGEDSDGAEDAEDEELGEDERAERRKTRAAERDSARAKHEAEEQRRLRRSAEVLLQPFAGLSSRSFKVRVAWGVISALLFTLILDSALFSGDVKLEQQHRARAAVTAQITTLQADIGAALTRRREVLQGLLDTRQTERYEPYVAARRGQHRHCRPDTICAERLRTLREKDAQATDLQKSLDADIHDGDHLLPGRLERLRASLNYFDNPEQKRPADVEAIELEPGGLGQHIADLMSFMWANKWALLIWGLLSLFLMILDLSGILTKWAVRFSGYEHRQAQRERLRHLLITRRAWLAHQRIAVDEAAGGRSDVRASELRAAQAESEHARSMAAERLKAEAARSINGDDRVKIMDSAIREIVVDLTAPLRDEALNIAQHYVALAEANARASEAQARQAEAERLAAEAWARARETYARAGSEESSAPREEAEQRRHEHEEAERRKTEQAERDRAASKAREAERERAAEQAEQERQAERERAAAEQAEQERQTERERAAAEQAERRRVEADRRAAEEAWKARLGHKLERDGKNGTYRIADEAPLVATDRTMIVRAHSTTPSRAPTGPPVVMKFGVAATPHDRSAARLIAREAHLLNKLKDRAGVVELLDTADDGLQPPFIVLRHYSRTLAQWWADEAAPYDLRRVVGPMAQALRQYRSWVDDVTPFMCPDRKPGNMMVDLQGPPIKIGLYDMPQIVQIDLAQALLEENSDGHVFEPRGTLMYASPRFGDEFSEPGPLDMLWAVCVMIWDQVTGQSLWTQLDMDGLAHRQRVEMLARRGAGYDPSLRLDHLCDVPSSLADFVVDGLRLSTDQTTRWRQEARQIQAAEKRLVKILRSLSEEAHRGHIHWVGVPGVPVDPASPSAPSARRVHLGDQALGGDGIAAAVDAHTGVVTGSGAAAFLPADVVSGQSSGGLTGWRRRRAAKQAEKEAAALAKQAAKDAERRARQAARDAKRPPAQ